MQNNNNLSPKTRTDGLSIDKADISLGHINYKSPSSMKSKYSLKMHKSSNHVPDYLHEVNRRYDQLNISQLRLMQLEKYIQAGDGTSPSEKL